MKLKIDFLIGFGYCPLERIQIEPGGESRLEYRYIPWPLQFPDATRINAALNQAARWGTPVPELTGLEFPHDIPPEENLTDFGLILWQSLPLYAVLTLKYPWITWEAYLPPGEGEVPNLAGPPRGVAYITRGDAFDPLMHEVLAAFPQNRWARLHFMGLEQMLPRLPDGTPTAMGMAEPLKGKLPETKSEPVIPEEPGWSQDLEFPRAHPTERVEYPNGLIKRVWIGLSNDEVEWARDWEAKEPNCAKTVEGAVAVVPPEGEEFDWLDHHFLRLDLPARTAPSVVRLLERSRIGHPAVWALRVIEPCFHDLDPHVTFAEDPAASGFRAAVVLPKPVFTYQPELLDAVLRDVRKRWR